MTRVPPRPVDAVFFDLFGTLLSLAPLDEACDRLAPGRGAEIAARWRARQLEASWLRTAMERWVDFDVVTRRCPAGDAAGARRRRSADDAILREVADAFMRRSRSSTAPRDAVQALRAAGVVTGDPHERLGADARSRRPRGSTADGPPPVGRRRAPVQAAPERLPARGRRDRAPGGADRLRDGQRLGRRRRRRVRVPRRLASTEPDGNLPAVGAPPPIIATWPEIPRIFATVTSRE